MEIDKNKVIMSFTRRNTGFWTSGIKLCECGCGEMCNGNSRYLRYHKKDTNKGKTWKWKGPKRHYNVGENNPLRKAVLNGKIIDMYGENNPMYIDGRTMRVGDGIHQYDKNYNRRFKRKIRQRDQKCVLCGRTKEENTPKKRELSVHHIDYNKQNTTEENCVALCNSCHTKTNVPENRDAWQAILEIINK